VLTAGSPGGPEFREPALAGLAGANRALLAYNAGDSLAFVVLDSAGAVVQAETPLPAGSRPTAAGIGPDRALAAWAADAQVKAVVLGGWPLAPLGAPSALHHPQSNGGEVFISAAAGQAGRGVITWIDARATHFNVYYALVGPEGEVLTPARLLRHSLAGLDTSREGFGAAAYAPSGLQRLWLPLAGR
jgi:hypothetical protein